MRIAGAFVVMAFSFEKSWITATTNAKNVVANYTELALPVKGAGASEDAPIQFAIKEEYGHKNSVYIFLMDASAPLIFGMLIPTTLFLA